MTSSRALFISHGAPTYVTDDIPARHFLHELGKELPRPDAVLTVTAHWETETPTLSSTAEPQTVHDFGGFPAELYEINYPAPGTPDTALKIASTLDAAGIKCELDDQRGFDHGTWVPLAIMYPEADIPVVQLSVQPGATPEAHFKTGQALSALKDENILIIGSGAITHNLRVFRKWPLEASLVPEAQRFADWWYEKATKKDGWPDLMHYRESAPHARWNHPSREHILPFFTVLGTGKQATRLHKSDTYGMLAMDIYAIH